MVTHPPSLFYPLEVSFGLSNSLFFKAYVSLFNFRILKKIFLMGHHFYDFKDKLNKLIMILPIIRNLNINLFKKNIKFSLLNIIQALLRN